MKTNVYSLFLVVVFTWNVFTTTELNAQSNIKLINKAELAAYSQQQKDQLKLSLEKKSAIIFEGSEMELMQKLDAPYYNASRSDTVKQIFARFNAPGKGYWLASFSVADKHHKKLVYDTEADTYEVLGESVKVNYTEEELKNIDDILLKTAQKWMLETEQKAKAQLKSGEVGEWNTFNTYTFTSIGGNDVIYTVEINPYKIRDKSQTKDWYLVQTKMHHEINIDRPYEQNFKLIGAGRVGWYIQDRELKISSTNTSDKLLSYGPTGTINSGSQSMNIGAGLSGGVSKDGPSVGAGIDAGYSKSWSYLDINMVDQSSLNSNYTYWKEAFVCPRNSYTWWPIVDWPANNSKNSFFSEPVGIFNTTNINTGVSLNIKSHCIAVEDNTTGYLGVVSISRSEYHLSIDRNITIGHNYAPNRPTQAVGNITQWINTVSTYSTSAEDPDCNPMEYEFDWGDNSSTTGGAAQSHTYTQGGEYAITVKALDLPHKESSDWSSLLRVKIKSITSIHIDGENEIAEGQFSLYNCAASYNFDEGNTINVSPDWSIIEGMEFASIDSNGKVTPHTGSGNNTIVIRAEYEDHGVNVRSDKSVFIIGSPLNLETQLQEKPTMKISPNPTFGQFSVKYGDKLNVCNELICCDLSGRIIYSTKVDNRKKIVVDLSNYPAGIYVVKLIGDNYQAATRIIKR